jgi:hypothetical protein
MRSNPSPARGGDVLYWYLRTYWICPKHSRCHVPVRRYIDGNGLCDHFIQSAAHSSWTACTTGYYLGRYFTYYEVPCSTGVRRYGGTKFGYATSVRLYEYVPSNTSTSSSTTRSTEIPITNTPFSSQERLAPASTPQCRTRLRPRTCRTTREHPSFWLLYKPRWQDPPTRQIRS